MLSTGAWESRDNVLGISIGWREIRTTYLGDLWLVLRIIEKRERSFLMPSIVYAALNCLCLQCSEDSVFLSR